MTSRINSAMDLNREEFMVEVLEEITTILEDIPIAYARRSRQGWSIFYYPCEAPQHGLPTGSQWYAVTMWFNESSIELYDGHPEYNRTYYFGEPSEFGIAQLAAGIRSFVERKLLDTEQAPVTPEEHL